MSLIRIENFVEQLKYDRDLGGYKDELIKVEKAIRSNRNSCKQEEASLSALRFECQGAEKVAKSLGLEALYSPAQPPEHHPDRGVLSSTMIEPKKGARASLDSSGGEFK